MKKLFTLVAFLTCFLGAKAIEIVDAEVDFSKYSDISEVKWAGWGASASALERLSIQDGCLHFESSEATNPSWDCQFHPIGGVQAEVDVTYTLHFKIKGDHDGNVSMLGFGQTPYGQFPITTEWVEGTVDYVCTSATGGDILMQCGDYVGTWDIAYLKITHEGKEQKPVEWANIIVNGDASAAWENADMEPQDPNNGTVCAWGKEWGYLMNDVNAASGGAAIPVAHPAIIEDGVFVSRAKAVDPILYYAEDTDLGWAQRSAGDQMDDNTWQNQFWINFPRPLKDGESFKLSFKYKASEDVTVPTQYHQQYPGNYLGGGNVGELQFTTEWQTYEKELSATANMQSVAFNVTGNGENWKRDIDFFFDDIQLSFMVLDEGYFAAATDIEDGTPEYDFDNAVEFEDEGDGLIAAVVGGESEDQWVNQVMVSTARGNDKGFKNNTLKVTGAILNDPENWMSYEPAANYKINLPVRGQWKIYLDTDEENGKLMSFEKLVGEEDKEKIEFVANPTEVVLDAEVRQSQDYDSQMWIVANRKLDKGTETYIEFDYYMESDEAEKATVGTQCHAEPSAYLHWSAIGNFDFTSEPQHFGGTFTVPDEGDGMQSIAFNMSPDLAGARVKYVIKNVIWRTADETESLINMEGGENFILKEGVGYGLHAAGTDPIPPSDAVEGDVNGDGEVGVGDLISVSNYMADGEESGVTLEQADVNKDGEVGVGDLISISNIMAGKEEE